MTDTRAHPADLDAIAPWRDRYLAEMACQVVHDSLHRRPGWTREYALHLAGEPVGYGSVVAAGPWTGAPTVYEFHVAPAHRRFALELFEALLDTSGAVAIEVQSNDPQAVVVLHAFGREVTSQSILFRDAQPTAHAPPGASFRTATRADLPDVPAAQLRWHGVVELGGEVAGTGGILFHYNRPYGDIFMEIEAPFRRRGLGAFLVQELKRVCYGGGHVPSARCDPANLASRRTLQRAGFMPCGHILHGTLPRAGRRG